METKGPYAGLRVVEFGQYIAVPFCAQLLADGGADVVKIEPLEGDPSRRNGQVVPGESRQYLNKNRGKRSLALSLADAEARAAVLALLDRTDIVLANFRPGLAARLGFDYETLAARNPRLIYAENTAFGTRGPLANATGMDMIMQARTGLAQMTPAGPQPLAQPMIDYAAALLLAWGVATALYQRERNGRGQKLNVSLLHAALVLQNNQISHIDAIDGWRLEFVEYLKHAFAEGKSWPEIIAKRQSLAPHAFAAAYYGFFPTADGILAIAAGGRINQLRVLKVLGVEDRWVTEPGWLPDDAAAHAEQTRRAVEAVLRQQPTAHWLQAFGAAGVPVDVAYLYEQVLEDEQARANGCFVRLEHDLVGGLTLIAPPVEFSATPLHASAASPPLGRDSRSVLRDAGLADDAIDRLVAAGAVHDG